MTTKPNFAKAVLVTGLVAGALDAVAASLQYYINTGRGPARIFRAIASAVFKEKTKTGDMNTWAAWGLLFHFLIAMAFTLFYFLFLKQIRQLFPHKYIAGIVYGIFTWCVMNLIVLTIAFDRAPKWDWKNSSIGMGILIIAIGLPISLLADRFYPKKN